MSCCKYFSTNGKTPLVSQLLSTWNLIVLEVFFIYEFQGECKMSAKTKLLINVGALFVAAIICISIVGFYQYKAASIHSYESKLDAQSFLVAQSVGEKMNRMFDGLSIMSKQVNITKRGKVDVDDLLMQLKDLKVQFNVLNAYLGLRSGATYSVNRNGLVPKFNAKEKKREWYLRAMAGEQKIITTPYKSASGNMVMAVAVPVIRNDTVVGVLSINLALDEITNFVQGLDHSNQIFVSRNDGFIMAAKYPEYIGTNLYDKHPSYAKYHNKKSSQHSYFFEKNEYLVVSNKVDEFGLDSLGLGSMV